MKSETNARRLPWLAVLALAGLAGCAARGLDDLPAGSDAGAPDGPSHAGDAADPPPCTDTEPADQCDPDDADSNDWMCDSTNHTLTGLSAGSTGSSFRKRCASASDCAPNEMCEVSVQIAALTGVKDRLCIPKCSDGLCRSVPGYDLVKNSPYCDEQVSCVVSCDSDSDCPPGVACLNRTICAGPFF